VAKLDYSLDQSGAAEPMGLYIVADGMGGYQQGEKASRDSVRGAFRDFIEGHILLDLRSATHRLSPPQASPTVEETLRTLVTEANRLVYRKRQETGTRRGTTITAVLIVGSKAAVANVGDSRTYLMRGGELRQLTQDHSLVFSLFKAGQITEEQIYSHPKKNEVYRSLGEQEDIKVDLFPLAIQAGDRLLLCSDGLWEMVRNPQIAAILANAATPQAACDRLVAAAFDNGGEDNISALAVYLEYRVARFSRIAFVARFSRIAFVHRRRQGDGQHDGIQRSVQQGVPALHGPAAVALRLLRGAAGQQRHARHVHGAPAAQLQPRARPQRLDERPEDQATAPGRTDAHRPAGTD